MRPWRATCAALMAGLGAALYAPTIRNGYTMDDFFVYARCGFVRSPAALRHLLTADYFRFSNEASYRPVVTLTYLADARLWREWSGGPHVTQIALFVAVLLLFHAAARKLLDNARAADLAAVLFAVHPIHHEVVASLSFREDLLVPLFLLSSWLLYRRSRTARSPAAAAGAFIAYGLALFSKESAAVYPALFLLLQGLDREPALRASRRGFWLHLAGLLALTAGFALVRFRWLRHPGEAAVPALADDPLGMLAPLTKIQGRYLLLLLFPLRLRAFYPPSFYSSGLDAAFWLSALALAAVAAALARWRRARPLAFGGAWWFAALAPASNLYPLFNPMAERYLFLPSLGPCLAAGWAAARALASRRGTAVRAALITAAAAMAWGTWARHPVWRSDRTLWESAFAEAPEDPAVLANLAAAEYEEGRYTNALVHAAAALRAAPRFSGRFNPGPAHLVHACSCYVLGRREQALVEAERARSCTPMRSDLDAAVYNLVGRIHEDEKRFPEALEAYEHAARSDHFNATAWRGVAICRLSLGRTQAAAEAWEKARALNPAMPAFARVLEVWEGVERP